MNELQNTSTKRILWVDIYKALAITLVVIGHATGQFNQFIYQFHLAAFFFISGYVVKQEQQGLLGGLMKRLYTLILPLVVMILVHAGGMAALHSAGSYELWFGAYPYIGFQEILTEFFRYGRLYAWYLGAAWFIGVLFFTALLSNLLYLLAGRKTVVYLIDSVMIYTIGYQFLGSLEEIPYNLDLVPIAQLFYVSGFCVRKVWNEHTRKVKWQWMLVIAIVTTVIMIALSTVSDVRIDYAGRSFSNIIVNTVSSLNGICFLYAISQLIAFCKSKGLIKVFNWIGQNTLGILLFHFVFFKVVYAGLYAIGLADRAELGRMTPSTELGNRYWWLFTAIAIAGSCVVWIALQRIPVTATLLGLNRTFYQRLQDWVKERLHKQKWQSYIQTNKAKWSNLYQIAVKGIAVIGFLGFAGWQCKYISLYICPQDIYFPNTSRMVSFSQGWLDQSNETYRWIQDKGVMTMKTLCHRKIHVEGCVPENFEEVSKLDIYVNDILVGTINTKENPFFGQDFKLPAMKQSTQLEITFDFDGVQKPQEGSGDPRTLSGMISRVYVE